VAQTAPSHSRLVTAKLTVTPFATTPAGWSRPSSAAPASTPGNNSASGTPPASNSKAASPAPPSSQQKESGKPVWGNVKPPAPVRPDIRPDDFPTAAEAVKGASVVANQPKSSKPEERQETAKQAATRVEDADTFRGVHLDPNAHHWDEVRCLLLML
jgi:serine/arginine repetitive matrix protein 2